MKTEFRYIHFVQQASKGITSVWSCRNIHHGDQLGVVKWNGAWREYCYFPTVQAVYSVECLRDIAEFIRLLANTRSTGLAATSGQKSEGDPAASR